MGKVYYILSGDCGGTNTRLHLTLHTSLASNTDEGLTVKKREFRNSEYGSFDEIMSEFLYVTSPTKHPAPTVVVLAAAGPVADNAVLFTNSGWLISGPSLSSKFSTEVKIVNDFVGQGYGVLTLKEGETRVLHDAERVPGAPIVCVGAGTGLGECYLTSGSEGGSYTCFPSEGGHAEFAPRNDTEFELLRFLKSKFHQKHRVSIERVVSGTGLANVYEFFCSLGSFSPQVKAEFDAAGDMKGRVVATGDCPAARKSMQVFAAAYGSECGTCALKFIPLGGLYVCGGLTPKNIDIIEGQQSEFMKAYRDKGRVSGLLEGVRMEAIMVEDLGMRGAQWLGVKMLREGEEGGGADMGRGGLGKILRWGGLGVIGGLAVVGAVEIVAKWRKK